MTQFHEGEEVEVEDIRFSYHEWRKAKIVCPIDPCEVQFPDGTRAVFGAAHIRVVDPDFEHAPESKPGGGFL